MAVSPQERSQVRPRTVWTIGLNLLGLVLVVAALRQTSMIVGWVLVSMFLALALHPAVDWLERHGLKRVFGVVLVVTALLALFAGLILSFVPMISTQIAEFSSNLPNLVARFRNLPFVEWAEKHFSLVEGVESQMNGTAEAAAGPAIAVARGVLESLVGTVSVIVLTVFMLLFGHQLRDGALSWIEPQRRERWQRLSGRMHRVVGGYVLGTMMVSAIGAIVTTIGLSIIGNPYYLALGLLMLFLGVIPWVGSTLGAIAMVLTTFMTGGLTDALIVAGAYLVYQQVENEVLHPLVQRQTIKMNPLLIALVLLFGTALFGVLGALLALPAAGALQVLLQDALQRRQARWATPATPAEGHQLTLTNLWGRDGEPPPASH